VVFSCKPAQNAGPSTHLAAARGLSPRKTEAKDKVVMQKSLQEEAKEKVLFGGRIFKGKLGFVNKKIACFLLPVMFR